MKTAIAFVFVQLAIYTIVAGQQPDRPRSVISAPTAERRDAYRARSAAYNFSQREPEYESFFASIGLTEQVRAGLKVKIRRLYEAKIKAATAPADERDICRADFERALAVYDEEIHELLGADYDKYKKFEQMLPDRREARFIRAHAASRGYQLEISDIRKLMELIHECSCYTKTSREWGGPYQPSRRPPRIRARRETSQGQNWPRFATPIL